MGIAMWLGVVLAGFSGTCESLNRCARCGALVYISDKPLHDDWHLRLAMITGG